MDNTAVRTNDPNSELHGVGHRLQTPERRHKQNKMRRKLIGLGIGAVLLIMVLTFAGLYFYRMSTGAANIDGSKYQAVFLNNGQVYFGKLQTLNGGYMKLTNVFYLQTKDAATTDSSKLQDASTQSKPGVELVKLGGEIHGPVDEMVISKDQILFFENLKQDGQVSDSITKYDNQKH